MEEIAITILKKIKELGYDAYLVGGYPRDKYLKKETKDIDICTNMPQEVLEANFSVLKSQFLSSVVEMDNYQFEITRYRKDLAYEKHRFPKEVIFVDTLKEDLNRRDFIMNTLCIDVNDEYVDLLGARRDLDQKIIRCVGDPFHKLEEDVLRILRAIRFASQLGFQLENNLELAIIKLAPLIEDLSLRRIEIEFNKIMQSDYKEYGLKLLKETGILQIIEKKRKRHIQ